jgi:hypothetical protein
MRLKLDTSWRRERIEFMLNPGDEIEVPDELGTEIERRYAHLVEVKADTVKPRVGTSPQEQAAAEAEETEAAAEKAEQAVATAAAPKPRRKRVSRRKSSSARKPAAKPSAKPAAAKAE